MMKLKEAVDVFIKAEICPDEFRLCTTALSNLTDAIGEDDLPGHYSYAMVLKAALDVFGIGPHTGELLDAAQALSLAEEDDLCWLLDEWRGIDRQPATLSLHAPSLN